jgi:hypothetical protein
VRLTRSGYLLSNAPRSPKTAPKTALGRPRAPDALAGAKPPAANTPPRHQVVCGRNFTVALNGIGQVLQMGSTGAVNHREHQAMWEGARMPVIVGGPLAGEARARADEPGEAGAERRPRQGAPHALAARAARPAWALRACCLLSPSNRAFLPVTAPGCPNAPTSMTAPAPAGMRAGIVAAGESHVLVACTLRAPRNGPYAPQPQPLPCAPAGAAAAAAWEWPGEPPAAACRLVAWGMNAQGQLGSAAAEDFNVPQFVVGINGRRVLHLAAGSTFSMAVCEHDPREAAARWSR